MSTIYLRAVVESALAAQKKHDLVPEAREALKKALSELEAIERAAKAMQGDDVRHALRHGDDEVMAARATFASIAKDAS